MGDAGGWLLPVVLAALLVMGLVFYLRGGRDEGRRDANTILTIWALFFFPALICTVTSILAAFASADYEGTQNWISAWIVLAALYAIAAIVMTFVTMRVFLRKLNIAPAHFVLFAGGTVMLILLSGMFALFTWANFVGLDQVGLE